MLNHNEWWKASNVHAFSRRTITYLNNKLTWYPCNQFNVVRRCTSCQVPPWLSQSSLKSLNWTSSVAKKPAHFGYYIHSRHSKRINCTGRFGNTFNDLRAQVPNEQAHSKMHYSLTDEAEATKSTSITIRFRRRLELLKRRQRVGKRKEKSLPKK